MSAEGVFKEALLFCLQIESLLESHSWISLAGQSGKAWWDVARPICSWELRGWMGFQICQCPAQIYSCAFFFSVARLSSASSSIVFNGTSEISRGQSKTEIVVLTLWYCSESCSAYIWRDFTYTGERTGHPHNNPLKKNLESQRKVNHDNHLLPTGARWKNLQRHISCFKSSWFLGQWLLECLFLLDGS